MTKKQLNNYGINTLCSMIYASDRAATPGSTLPAK